MAGSESVMPDPKAPSWAARRAAIFGLLLLCAGVIVFVVGWGEDSQIHRTALMWAFGAAVGTVFAYAGFATFEDISLARLVR